MEFSGHDQEKISWVVGVSGVLVLKGVTQKLCGKFKGEALFCLELPRVN